MVYFTSDLHISHKGIIKFRDRFKTAEEHDEYMFSKIEALSKRDILMVLGDFIFDSEDYDKVIERLSKVECRIKLVMGNHDSRELYKEDCVEMQLPLYSYKNMWISHCPIHPQEMRGRIGNCHGHLHLEKLDDPRYFNVNIDVNDYEFVKLDTIKEHFKNI